MLKTLFNISKEVPFHVLCLGAHPDDIEIGCGGTILQLIDAYPQINVSWIVFGANRDRGDEAQKSAELFLTDVAEKQIVIKGFRDGYFPYNGAEIKDYFEEIKSYLSPDLIFSHYRNDLHQDHRLIEELTWNTFRNHLILEYEIPKFDGDLGNPNFYVCLGEEVVTRKVDYLQKSFPSQKERPWFTDDFFISLMRLRGVEAVSSSKYAEGFFAYKIVQ
jgi:LmbE family N-acetylglucosaminyl deacetylase